MKSIFSQLDLNNLLLQIYGDIAEGPKLNNYTMGAAYDKEQDLRVAFHTKIFRHTKAVLHDKTKLRETAIGSLVLGKTLYGFNKYYHN